MSGQSSNWSNATGRQLEAMLMCRCGAVNRPNVTTIWVEGSQAACDCCGRRGPLHWFIPYPKEQANT